MLKTKLKGFTLIELIVVIGIIAILAGIVIVAVNPNKQFGQARDAQRRNDVLAILNAVYQNATDNNGVLPTDVSGATTATCIGTGVGCVDLTQELASGTNTYLSSIPNDPSNGAAADTGYEVQYDATSKRVTVSAPSFEQATTTIQVTR